MSRKETPCHEPTADDAQHPATPPANPPCPSPAPHAPLLHDFLSHANCSRREALILLATIALIPTSAHAAPAEEDSRLKRMMARFTADPRLEQTVSLTTWSEPIDDLLARLSQQTGVMLRFEGSEVGDQRVNVVLKDQPLSRALALLAEALNLYWRRERKEGSYRYVLFQDAASRKQEQEIQGRLRERFEDGIHRMVDSLKLTPPEIDKLRATCGWAWHLQDPTRRLAIEILGRLATDHLKPALQTGSVDIPLASLSPGDQALVLRFVEAMNRDRQKIILERGFPPGSHIIGDMTRPGGHVSITVLGGIPIGWDSFLDLGVEAADGKGSYLGVIPGHTDEEVSSMENELLPPRFDRERRNPASDGGPRVALSRTPWEDKSFLPWEEVLKAVVESADLQIVGDSYLYYWWEANSTLPSPSALRDRPLVEVLDQITPPFLYVWRREGDVVLFRHRNWFTEKRHNVPDRDIRRWRAHLKRDGRLTLEDAADLSLLTDRQHGMLHHKGIPGRAVRDHRHVLRLYAALDSVQRGKLETTGLRLRDLRAPQLELLRAWKPEAAEATDARLRLRREPEAALFALTAEGRAPLEERVPLEPG